MFTFLDMLSTHPESDPARRRKAWAALRREVEQAFPRAFPGRTLSHSTGYFGWDAVLGGGWREGMLQECIAPGWNAGLALWVDQWWRMVAESGEWAACIDWPDAWDVAATTADMRSRVLWVRPREAAAAVEAADLLLRDGHFKWVLLDLVGAPRRAWARIPPARWVRLQRLAQRERAVLLVLGSERIVPGSHPRWVLEGPVHRLEDLDASRSRLLPGIRVKSWEPLPAVARLG